MAEPDLPQTLCFPRVRSKYFQGTACLLEREQPHPEHQHPAACSRDFQGMSSGGSAAWLTLGQGCAGMTSAEQPRSLGEIWWSWVPTQVGVVGAPHPRGHDCCSHGLWPEVAPCLGPSRGDVSGNPFPACLTPSHSVSAEGGDGQVFPHAPSIVSSAHTAHFRGPEGTSGGLSGDVVQNSDVREFKHSQTGKASPHLR